MVKIKDLKAAKKLVERGWCKKAYARDKRGATCHPFDKVAAKFCIMGALIKATNNESIIIGNVFNTPGNPAIFNDATNKKGVLKLFDEAIKAMKKG